MSDKRSYTASRIRAAKTANGLTGLAALICYVIALAYTDAIGNHEAHKTDALEYFESETYKEHLTFLGLPPDTMPENLIGG